MEAQFTSKTVRQYIDAVSDQYYPMTGPVIALMAAHAAALAEACMQLSLDHQVDKLDWQDVTARIGQMAHLKDTLVEWSNQDISTGRIDDTLAAVNGYHLALCDYSTEIARLSTQAAQLLHDFRSLTYQEVAGDLEIAVYLLASTARAALRLLADNVAAETTSDSVQKYQAVMVDLTRQLAQLSSGQSS
ncbi:MAG: hypothetical protein H6632_06685 [Anaerolineales bacterium]|nr:hypothetical protein [Anaerolineales bacterium]